MNNFSDDFLKQFSLMTLSYCDNDVIEKVNRESGLFKNISHYFDYFCDNAENIEKVIEGLKLIDIKFEEISIRRKSNQFIEFVYSNNLYVFNQDNIIKMYYMFYPQSHTFHSLPTYTMICALDRLNDSYLKQYIDENINDYIVMLLSSYEHDITDNTLSLARILNEKNIKIDEKREYISKLNLDGIVSDITTINNCEIWTDLIDRNYIEYNDNNIFSYYCINHRLDNTLIEFIKRNSNEGIHIDNIIPVDSKKTYVTDFVDDILKCNTINEKVFHSMLSSDKVYYESFAFTGVSSLRISKLIEMHRIAMNITNLLFFRESYPEQVIRFAENNIEAYVNIVMSNTAGFNYDETIKLLQSHIEHRFKTSLINLCNMSISVVRNAFSIEVEKNIVSSICFDTSDFVSLFQAYPKMDIDYQTRLFMAVKRHFTYICENKIQLPNDLYQKLLNSGEVDLVDLFISQLKYWDELAIVQALHSIDKRTFTAIFDPQRQPRFEINDENKKMLEAFVDEGYIQNYKIGKNDKYRIIRNKP